MRASLEEGGSGGASSRANQPGRKGRGAPEGLGRDSLSK